MNTVLILIVIIAILYFFISRQPDDFRISRSQLIKGPAEPIYALVNDYHEWQKWSPWAKLDPHAKETFEGPQSGVGATMRWEGNLKVGAGSMTIIESNSPELIRMKLDFLKPMRSTSMADFTFAPTGAETLVTWSMYGKNNFAAKAMNLFMNCEKLVGGHFEQGLNNLKSLIERPM
jgi:hypothetical protein